MLLVLTQAHHADKSAVLHGRGLSHCRASPKAHPESACQLHGKQLFALLIGKGGIRWPTRAVSALMEL